MRRVTEACSTFVAVVLLSTSWVDTAVASGSVTTSVEAAKAREQDRRAALEEAHKALRLFNQQRWRAALALFEKANQRHAAPTLELYMARCQDRLGKLLAARKLYGRVTARPLPTNASTQFRNARRDANSELKTLRKRIPRIIVRLSGSAVVRLDGKEIRRNQHGSLDVDPGKHVVEATAQGRRPLKKVVSLDEAAEVTVTFAFEETKDEQAPATAYSPEPEPEPSTNSLTPAIVAYSVGGVALGVGIVTGAMTVAKTNSLEAQCDATLHCPISLEAEAESAHRIATVSTVGFALAGVGAAVGTALLIWKPFSDEGKPTQLEARVGPASLSLRGTF